ncbi:MAG: TonB-dependent receptor, partial [Candidatus Marinimicrobia bacterium]|nr:TonB-dependent receptor [Candidatus Neomarinimicrobiota bacterium]
MKYIFFLTATLISTLFSQLTEVSGVVFDNKSKIPLEGVNISSNEVGTVTNKDGKFRLLVDDENEIIFSFIGYETISTKIKPQMTIFMNPSVLRGDEIVVSATRAVSGKTPVSFSNLTLKEIETRNTAQDIPMVLASEPGVWAYSESGNGTGYSYVSIRGFDQSRIGVMIDGVPLNDNESHQVYWVDHGDLLADAKDVQIQRGIGNSLYGSSAFGGSININTNILSDKREIGFSYGQGDWNTTKYRTRYRSGKDFGDNLSLVVRTSQIKSDGYRDNHNSKQNGLFFGLEHRGEKITNQFRALIGYENTQLLWDGIYMEDIDDRTKRRTGNKAYTDNFSQQIYSLNTRTKIRENIFLKNTSYLVLGQGYYEVNKSGQDYYSYNLDVNNEFSDNEEQSLSTDFLRRKWIDNNYFGVVPTITWFNKGLRIDLGGEIRYYTGDHFGEVSKFSNERLASQFGDSWYRYYQYVGKKNSMTSFIHFNWHPIGQPFTITADFQNQIHNWKLEQEKIGHAVGHKLTADWNFSNPRMGMIWELSDSLNMFVSWGKAQKEPADNQIIQADDVWSDPVMAAAEVITDFEWGLDFTFGRGKAKFNGYNIKYLNEQLKNIDVNQEGEYDYYLADSTEHMGFEWETEFILNNQFSLAANGALVMNYFNDGKSLPNVPSTLFNLSIDYQPIKNGLFFIHWRRIGNMYVDRENTEEGMIDPFSVWDMGIKYRWQGLEIMAKVNNVFDKLYSTYGYGYNWDGYKAYYWPGATRNTFINIS